MKQNVNLVWNDNGVLLDTGRGKGRYLFTDFSGHVHFHGTDCVVEHADFVLEVANTDYLDGTRKPFAPWSADLNRLRFLGGTVVSGRMHAYVWEGGEFKGESLHVYGEEQQKDCGSHRESLDCELMTKN